MALAGSAIVFFLSGLVIGYWVIPDSKSASAECIVLRKDPNDLTHRDGTGSEGSSADQVVDLYNQYCR